MAQLVPGRLSEYRKRLSDPGKRSTIPDAYLKSLNPGLYQKRLTNQQHAQQNATLYNPMAILSGEDLRKGIAGIVNPAYDPQIQSAQADRKLAIANDAALAERIAGYYKQASGIAATAHEAAQGAQDKLTAALAANNQRSSDAMGAIQAGDQKFAGEDAALRGTGVDGGMSQRLTDDFQRQQAAMTQQGAARDNVAATSAEGWAGLTSMMQGAIALQGADTLSQTANASANRETKLSQGILDIQGQKAAATMDVTQKMRQSQFENAVTGQTLKIKGQQADTAAATAAFNAKYKADTLAYKKKHDSAVDQLRRDLAAQASGDRSAGLKERIAHDRAMERNAAQRLTLAQNKEARAREKAGLDAGKLPQRTPLQQSKFSSDVAHLVNGIVPELKSGRGIPNTGAKDGDPKWIVPPKPGGYSRKEIGQLILKDPKSPEELAVVVALDVAMDGHISPGTIVKLHNAGMSLKALPYKKRVTGPRGTTTSGTNNYPDKSGHGGGA